MLVEEMLNQIDNERKFATPIGVISISGDKAFYGMLLGKYKKVLHECKEKHKERCKKEPRVTSDIQNAEKSILQFLQEIYQEMKRDFASVRIYDVDDKAIEALAREIGLTWKSEAIIATIYDYLESTDESISSKYRQMVSERITYFQSKYKMSVEQYLAKEGLLAALQNVFDDEAEILVFMVLALIQKKANTNFGINTDAVLGEQKDNSRTLLENVENGIVPEQDIDNVLYRISTMYPYLTNVYFHIIERHGDEEKEVENLANYVGIDVHTYKDKLAKKFLKEQSVENEEAAEDAKEKLLNYCAYLGIETAKSEAVAQIDKRLLDYDLLYRTVEGVVCETREGADFARQELPEITAFMEKVKPPTSDDLLDYEWELQEAKLQFENKFQSELKSKYLDIMDEYLADFDDTFCTVGLFKKLDRKSAGKERLLKVIKKLDVSTIKDIDEAYQQMKELLPRVGLEEEEADSTLKYLESCKDSLALAFVKEKQGTTEEDAVQAKAELISYCEKIGIEVTDDLKAMQYIDKRLYDFDLKYRTVDGVECKTREGADKAREELPQIQAYMNQLISPNQNSLLDYEQEMLEKKQGFEDIFHSELKEKYLKTFEKYLKDFDKMFCSLGLLKKGTRKEAGIYRATKYAKGLKITSAEELEKAYVDIRELFPKLGITEAEATEAMSILNKKGENLQNKKGFFGGLFKM